MLRSMQPTLSSLLGWFFRKPLPTTSAEVVCSLIVCIQPASPRLPCEQFINFNRTCLIICGSYFCALIELHVNIRTEGRPIVCSVAVFGPPVTSHDSSAFDNSSDRDLSVVGLVPGFSTVLP
ncbi:hypothetical protein LSTR_LSTR012943 [Laodelphax striatellus]|uniref:Uncharacterized protein n=1 Tax=Laodelphax striatellus TaxID=195883 RepID=A0A482XKH1_LAOST|nr:hypothetical protein LSTR_LSTR012943 [Laodelphax striatellus]